MARYRRVNIDGQSLYKTETRKVAAASLPGTFVTINGDDEFAVAAATVGRLYVLDPAFSEGLGITDSIPAGHSTSGNYVEEGRELAILCPAGTYAKDTPIKLGANGQGRLPTLTPTPFLATARTMQPSLPALPTLSACASA